MSCNTQCKPCNPIKFDNSSGFNNRKAQERLEKQKIFAKQTELSTMSCGKKIVSITRVEDTVVIMHSDCSFSTAPLSVMDVSAFTQEATRELSETIDKLQKEREEQVKKLTELEKDIEELKKSSDNKPTEPETKLNDSKVGNADLTELTTKVTGLATGLQSLKEAVVLKSDLIEEVHTSFNGSDEIIKTLKFKGK